MKTIDIIKDEGQGYYNNQKSHAGNLVIDDLEEVVLLLHKINPAAANFKRI
jgi:hypothetical protein